MRLTPVEFLLPLDPGQQGKVVHRADPVPRNQGSDRAVGRNSDRAVEKGLGVKAPAIEEATETESRLKGNHPASPDPWSQSLQSQFTKRVIR